MLRALAIAFTVLISFQGFAQRRMIPHVTPIGGDFSTSFVLVNPTDQTSPFTLTPYANDGTLLPDVIGDLAPGETRFVDTETLFGGTVSHFLIGENDTVEITVVYQDAEGNNSAAHVPAADRTSSRWQIYPGELDDVLDGLAVVNMDAVTRDIVVRQLALDGSEIASVTAMTLAPDAKGLYIYGDFVKTPGTYYEIISEGELALTALRFAQGAPDARYFWASAAVALPALAVNQAPVITGQGALSVQSGNELTITLDDLTVSDDDNTYPDDFTLAVADGSNYSRSGNTITPTNGFTGDLSVPVTVNDGQADSNVYQLTVEVTAAGDPRVGKVAQFRNNTTYGVSGRAVILDERTIRLENFSYNGTGPDVRVYLGQDLNFITAPIIITDSISGMVYNNATVDLPLPDNVTLDDFNSISIWCTLFSISFSEGMFE